MPEEYFDVAYINNAKAILHGRIAAGRDENGFHHHAEVEQVLTDVQVGAIEALAHDSDMKMQRLLSGFVVRP